MSSESHKSPKQHIHNLLHTGGVEKEFRLRDHSNNAIQCISRNSITRIYKKMNLVVRCTENFG